MHAGQPCIRTAAEMTAPFFLKPDRNVIPTSGRPQRTLTESIWKGWLSSIGVCVALIVLGLIGGSDASGRFEMAVRWLSIAVLVGSAWICPPRFTIISSLLAFVTWSWIEVRASDWSDWLPGHLVRLIVAIGLVACIVRLRRQLSAAQRLARVDSLTGLPNRQALIEALEAELSRSKRFGRPFSLAILDCDGFKQINDAMGHLVGDDVLRRIAESLRNQTRRYDCAGRWGGDEFLIVLSELDQDGAHLVAERIRAAMRHDVEREHPSLTFSMGVITIRDPDQDWECYVRRADEAMYTAKRIGRDQTCFDIIEAAN